MLLIASKIVLCLVVATLLGLAIGYLLRKRQNKQTQDRSDLLSKEDKVIEESAPQTILDEAAPQTIPEKITPIQSSKPTDTKEIEKPQVNLQKRDIADDLTKIKGVGEKIEKSLNELGIYTYEEIANWNEENIDFINKNVAFKGRTSREDWVKHAKILAHKKNSAI